MKKTAKAKLRKRTCPVCQCKYHCDCEFDKGYSDQYYAGLEKGIDQGRALAVEEIKEKLQKWLKK